MTSDEAGRKLRRGFVLGLTLVLLTEWGGSFIMHDIPSDSWAYSPACFTFVVFFCLGALESAMALVGMLLKDGILNDKHNSAED